MKIVNRYPPNIDFIKSKITVPATGLVMCVGDTIYNPDGKELTDHLIVHESVHSEQQKAYGNFEAYLERYATDPQFRIEQEAEAYGAQLKFIKVHYGLDNALIALGNFSNWLSSDIYGSVITPEAAREMIRSWAYDYKKRVYS